MQSCRIAGTCAVFLMVFAPRTALSAPPSPSSFTKAVQPLERVARVRTEVLDLEAVLAEDALRAQLGGPYRFAIPRSVRITPDTQGTWEPIDDETTLWRVRVTCPEATSINLGFSRYHMPPGGFLFVYSTDREEVLAPFTEDHNAQHGQL